MTLRRRLPLVLIILLLVLMSAPNPSALAAVTLSSLTAEGQLERIIVHWTTASEVDNVGFNLLRSGTSTEGPFAQINATLIPSQLMGVIGADYVYTDTTVTPGQDYFYELQSLNTNLQLEVYPDFVTSAKASGPPSSVPTLPPTHTPVPSSTPTPTDTPTPTATGPEGPTPTATVAPSTHTPTPTRTPQPGTLAATGPTATATPNAVATLAPPLPSSPTPTRTVEPGRTPTSSVATVVAPTAAQRLTATHSTTTLASQTATPQKSASGGVASLSTPIRSAQPLSPAAETPQVERGRLLIGVALIGLGIVLGLSVLAVAGYFLWGRPSRP